MTLENKVQNSWIRENFFSYPSNVILLDAFNKEFKINLSLNAFKGRILRMGLKRKSEEEKNKWLIENYDKYQTMTELTEAYCKAMCCKITNIYSLTRRCSKLGLHKINLFDWDNHPEASEWIKQNYYLYKTYSDLSQGIKKDLGFKITAGSMKWRCGVLNLPSKFKKTEEQKNWIINNIDKYSVKELTILFNKTFGTNYKPENLRKFCNNYLNIYFSNNKERLVNAIVELYYKKNPIGTERVSSRGEIFVKVENNHWISKARYVNGLKDKDGNAVIVIDKNKPITKENTLVTDKNTLLSFINKGYENLPVEIKKLAMASCKLQTILKEEKQND